MFTHLELHVFLIHLAGMRVEVIFLVVKKHAGGCGGQGGRHRRSTPTRFLDRQQIHSFTYPTNIYSALIYAWYYVTSWAYRNELISALMKILVQHFSTNII